MTLENTQTAITYQGTGFVAEYPLPFPVPAKEHIVLEGSDASGYPVSFNPGIDYQITQVRDDGRTLRPTGVKFAKPLPAGWRITLRRVLPLVQEHPFHNQGPYSPRILEQCLDKQMMVSQQLEAGIASVKKDLGGARENLENMKDRLARQEQMLLELGD